MLHTNTLQGFFHFEGCTIRSGCSVTLKGSSAEYPHLPANRLDILSAKQFLHPVDIFEQPLIGFQVLSVHSIAV
jgi:hypothetical protein